MLDGIWANRKSKVCQLSDWASQDARKSWLKHLLIMQTMGTIWPVRCRSQGGFWMFPWAFSYVSVLPLSAPPFWLPSEPASVGAVLLLLQPTANMLMAQITKIEAIFFISIYLSQIKIVSVLVRRRLTDANGFFMHVNLPSLSDRFWLHHLSIVQTSWFWNKFKIRLTCDVGSWKGTVTEVKFGMSVAESSSKYDRTAWFGQCPS